MHMLKLETPLCARKLCGCLATSVFELLIGSCKARPGCGFPVIFRETSNKATQDTPPYPARYVAELESKLSSMICGRGGSCDLAFSVGSIETQSRVPTQL